MALSGGSGQSIAIAAASPYVNQLIKKATEDYPALNIPTHILWGAVEAELMGGKSSTGAISTAAGELGAKYLTEHLYNKDAKDLTETERTQIKEMAKVLAGVVGGLAAAGQGASAVRMLSDASAEKTLANFAIAGVKAGRSTSQQLSIDAIYTGMTLVNDKNKSDKEIERESLARMGGSVISVPIDYGIKGNSVIKQIISNVIGNYTENRMIKTMEDTRKYKEKESK